MSSYWNSNDGDQEYDEDDETVLHSGRDAVIFVIDAADSFISDEEQFRNCLGYIESAMKNLIIQSEKDLIGVVFYNTNHSPLPRDQSDVESLLVAPKNTAIFMHLSAMSKDTIAYMKHFKESEDFFDFKNRYGSVTSENLSEVLWLCSRMLMRCRYKLKQSNIFLFTNNDQPYQEPSHEFDKCVVRAKDLRDLGVHFTVVPMIDDEFNMNVFYKEFICSVNDFDPETYEFKSPAEQRQRFESRVYRKDYRSNCSRYFNLTIGDGLAISCGLYSFSRALIPQKSVHLLASTNEIVVARRVYMSGTYDEDMMEMQYNKRLLPGEQRKVMEVGGQKLIFTPEEVTKLRSMFEPGMRLLGFKPMNRLPTNCALKSTKFIYPNEKNTKGSKKLFRALWEKCIEKDKYVMCVFAQIRKTAPRYVALVPQQRELTGDDGFRLVYFPMQTDIRSLDVYGDNVPEIPANAIEAMKKITKKLKFNYKPDMFENPYQMAFHANLEALVFEQERDVVEDVTLPDINFQDSKIQPMIHDLIELFGRDVTVTSTKRPAPNANGGPSAKMPKSANREDILAAISTNALGKITVAMLKEFLTTEGVSGIAKLTKPALIEKVKAHCNL